MVWYENWALRDVIVDIIADRTGLFFELEKPIFSLKQGAFNQWQREAICIIRKFKTKVTFLSVKRQLANMY